MNKQEIFDKVARHLLTQNAKSISKSGSTISLKGIVLACL